MYEQEQSKSPLSREATRNPFIRVSSAEQSDAQELELEQIGRQIEFFYISWVAPSIWLLLVVSDQAITHGCCTNAES
jgi:hypothetical protein